MNESRDDIETSLYLINDLSKKFLNNYTSLIPSSRQYMNYIVDEVNWSQNSDQPKKLFIETIIDYILNAKQLLYIELNNEIYISKYRDLYRLLETEMTEIFQLTNKALLPSTTEQILISIKEKSKLILQQLNSIQPIHISEPQVCQYIKKIHELSMNPINMNDTFERILKYTYIVNQSSYNHILSEIFIRSYYILTNPTSDQRKQEILNIILTHSVELLYTLKC